MYASTRTYIQKYTHTRTHTYIYIYVFTYTHTYTYLHTWMHIHRCADGFGVGYIIKDDNMQFCVTTYNRQTARFIHSLEDTLITFQRVLMGTHFGANSASAAPSSVHLSLSLSPSLSLSLSLFLSLLWVPCHFTGFARLVGVRSKCSPSFLIQKDLCMAYLYYPFPCRYLRLRLCCCLCL